MTTDHNEAMSQLPHKLATLIKCLPQAPFRDHLAAECIKQAERIAELELQPAFAQLASDLAVKLADTEAERDTLRAEVERLRVERERWYTSFEHVSRILSGIHALMYQEPFALSDGRTLVFRPKGLDPHEILQALSDRIRAIPDEVAAIDTARKATQ